jgi:hypothetical protein
LFERASHYVSAADGNKFNFDEGEPSSTNRAAHVNARSRNILRLQGTFPGKLLLYRWGISGEYMRKSFLISTAVVALIAAAGLANAQAPGASGSQSAPATMNRSDVPGAKAKQDDAKDGVKSKAVESRPVDKAVETKPDKAVGKPAAEMNVDKSKDGMKADSKSATDTRTDQKMPASGSAQSAPDAAKDGLKADSKSTTDSKSGTTTGQAGTAVRQLNPEQRTTIRTVIKEQNVKPVTNVNFSISVGTQVPRTVTFHPVPRQLVTIYPDWQGYEYFLVGDQIIVVNPRTMHIVAVLEA